MFPESPPDSQMEAITDDGKHLLGNASFLNGSVSASAPSRRFSAKGLAKHRAKLGISAADYARLVGVSPLTIYAWEKGRSRPRQAQLEALGAVRGLGVREVLERIGGRTPRGRKSRSKKP